MKCPEIPESPSKNNFVNRPNPNMHNVDFSEYLWMGEELEEFDRKVEEEFWEEEFIEACFEQMLAEEETSQSQWYIGPQDLNNGQNNLADSFQNLALHVQRQNTSNGDVYEVFFSDYQQPRAPPPIQNSKLNPEAPEFIPSSLQQDR